MSTTLKIKPPRPKYKRCGLYLYIEFPGGETHVLGGVRSRRVDAVQRQFRVTSSRCGQYALAEGQVGDKSVQYALALDDGRHEIMVAGRWSGDDTWWFWGGDNDTRFVPRCQITLITNEALIAAALVQRQIPQSFAKFLGLESPTLCNGDMICEMQQSSHYALLRKYDFQSVTPDGPIGKGRRAENRVRHRFSNYEAMLACGGGLLRPDAYATLRKGVDRLVKDEINRATNRATRP